MKSKGNISLSIWLGHSVCLPLDSFIELFLLSFYSLSQRFHLSCGFIFPWCTDDCEKYMPRRNVFPRHFRYSMFKTEPHTSPQSQWFFGHCSNDFIVHINQNYSWNHSSHISNQSPVSSIPLPDWFSFQVFHFLQFSL